MARGVAREEVEDGLGVGGGDGAEEVGAVEEAGVEEVGRYAPGFQRELAELEDGAGEAGVQEVGFVGGHGGVLGGRRGGGLRGEDGGVRWCWCCC